METKQNGSIRKSKTYGAVGVVLGTLALLNAQAVSADENTAAATGATNDEVVAQPADTALSTIAESVDETPKATNLSDPQPASSAEHLSSLENPGETVGQPLTADVESSGLDQAVSEAEKAGVIVDKNGAITTYDNHGEAQANLDNQEKKVEGVTETKKEVEAILKENTEEAKRAGVIETPTATQIYKDNNKGALADAKEQSGRVDVAVQTQIQILTDLPQAVREALDSGVVIEGITRNGNEVKFAKSVRYADAKQALDKLAVEVAKMKLAQSTEQEIEKMVSLALSEAEKSGVKVNVKNSTSPLLDLEATLREASSVVSTIGNYISAQEDADKALDVAKDYANVNGLDLNIGTTKVTSDIKEAKSISDKSINDVLAAIEVKDKANADLGAEVAKHDNTYVVKTGTQTLSIDEVEGFIRSQIDLLKNLGVQTDSYTAYQEALKKLNAFKATYAEKSNALGEPSETVTEKVTVANLDSEIAKALAKLDLAISSKAEVDRKNAEAEKSNAVLGEKVKELNASLDEFGHNGETINVSSVEEALAKFEELKAQNSLPKAEAEQIAADNRRIMEEKGLAYTGDYATDKATVDRWNAENAGERVSGNITSGITTTAGTNVSLLTGNHEIYGSQARHRYIFTEGNLPEMVIGTAWEKGGKVEFLVKETSNGDVKLTFFDITPTAESLWTKDQVFGTVGIDVKGNGGIGFTVGVVAGGAVSNVGGAIEGGGNLGGNGSIISGAGTWLKSFKLRIETAQGVQYLTVNDIDNGQSLIMDNSGAEQKHGSAISRGGWTFSAGGGNVVQGTTGVLGSHSVEFNYGDNAAVNATATITNSSEQLFHIIAGLFGPSSVHEIKENIPPIAIREVKSVDIPRLVPEVMPSDSTVRWNAVSLELAEVPKPDKVEYKDVNVKVAITPVSLETTVTKPTVKAVAEGIQMTVPTHKIELATEVNPVLIVQKPTNKKDVRNAENVDINGKAVVKGSTNSWGTGGEVLKAGRPLFYEIIREDFLASGQEVNMALTQASNPNITFTYDAERHSVIQRINDNIIAEANLDQTRPFVLPEGRIYTTALHDNGQWENTFTTVFKYADTVIIDKDGKPKPGGKTNTYTVKSNKVGYYTPSKPEPEKHIYTKQGQQVDGKVLLPNSEYEYTAVWDMSRFAGIIPTDKDISKGGGFIDDPQDSTVTFDFSRAVWHLADGTLLDKDLLVRHEFDSIHSISDEILKAFVQNSGVAPEGRFGLWVPSNYKEFVNKYLVTGTKLYMTFPVMTGDYVGQFNNKVYQIDFGNGYEGNIVENSVPKLEAIKDVIDHIGSNQSINDGFVKLNQKFPYVLKSPAVPMNLAGGVQEVRLFDDFDERYDRYDGEFYSFLSRNLELKNGKKLLDDEEFTKHIRQVLTRNESGQVIAVDFYVDEDFLAQIKEDQVLEFVVYPMVTRIEYGENIENTLVAFINGAEVSRSTVKTHTPPPTPDPEPVPTPSTPERPTLPNTGDAQGNVSAIGALALVVAGALGFAVKRKEEV